MKENQFPKKISPDAANLIRHHIKNDLSWRSNGRLKPEDVVFYRSWVEDELIFQRIIGNLSALKDLLNKTQ